MARCGKAVCRYGCDAAVAVKILPGSGSEKLKVFASLEGRKGNDVAWRG